MPKVVRIGKTSENTSEAIKSITLEHIINQEIAQDPKFIQEKQAIERGKREVDLAFDALRAINEEISKLTHELESASTVEEQETLKQALTSSHARKMDAKDKIDSSKTQA
mgnify:CR=1 FL=1